jgi:hypothetical protein
MQTITGKENKGSTGSEKSKIYNNGSSISALPKSTNSSLGVDGATAAGSAAGPGGRAVSLLKTSKEMNSGASVKKSSMDGFTNTEGTVGARENMNQGRTGNFAKSAKSGNLPRVSRAIYGSQARADGDGSGGGNGGSMEMSRRGLKGSGNGY